MNTLTSQSFVFFLLQIFKFQNRRPNNHNASPVSKTDGDNERNLSFY
jgi:hypothetical protein